MTRKPPPEPAAPRRYKGFTPRMGVYIIRHLPSGRTLLDASPHLDGILNRHRFQLKLGNHANKRLQADWNADGEAAFAFEVLDELPPDPQQPDEAQSLADLAELAALWREKLALTAEQSYNPPPRR